MIDFNRHVLFNNSTLEQQAYSLFFDKSYLQEHPEIFNTFGYLVAIQGIIEDRDFDELSMK